MRKESFKYRKQFALKMRKQMANSEAGLSIKLRPWSCKRGVMTNSGILVISQVLAEFCLTLVLKIISLLIILENFFPLRIVIILNWLPPYRREINNAASDTKVDWECITSNAYKGIHPYGDTFLLHTDKNEINVLFLLIAVFFHIYN